MRWSWLRALMPLVILLGGAAQVYNAPKVGLVWSWYPPAPGPSPTFLVKRCDGCACVPTEQVSDALSAATRTFVDLNIELRQAYTYHVVAVYGGGRPAHISPPVCVSAAN